MIARATAAMSSRIISLQDSSAAGMGWLLPAGHDEDSKSTKEGRPIIRMLKMAQGMLDAVKHFKMSTDAPLQIRIGASAEDSVSHWHLALPITVAVMSSAGYAHVGTICAPSSCTGCACASLIVLLLKADWNVFEPAYA